MYNSDKTSAAAAKVESPAAPHNNAGIPSSVDLQGVSNTPNLKLCGMNCVDSAMKHTVL